MRTVFWRDMLVVGTAVNLLASFGAILAASLGASTGMAVALHFAPLPYNVFLFSAVGRASPRKRITLLAAFAWLGSMTVV